MCVCVRSYLLDRCWGCHKELNSQCSGFSSYCTAHGWLLMMQRVVQNRSLFDVDWFLVRLQQLHSAAADINIWPRLSTFWCLNLFMCLFAVCWSVSAGVCVHVLEWLHVGTLLRSVLCCAAVEWRAVPFLILGSRCVMCRWLRLLQRCDVYLRLWRGSVTASASGQGPYFS